MEKLSSQDDFAERWIDNSAHEPHLRGVKLPISRVVLATERHLCRGSEPLLLSTPVGKE